MLLPLGTATTIFRRIAADSAMLGMTDAIRVTVLVALSVFGSDARSDAPSRLSTQVSACGRSSAAKSWATSAVVGRISVLELIVTD